jgi:hypothetical protein
MADAKIVACVVIMAAVVAASGCATGTGQATQSIYARWAHGPSADPEVFPIGVWLQEPANAGRYKAAGINFYVGLWKGPTEDQLTELRRHGMPAICTQNEVGLKHKDDSVIIGWMLQDEPDNAQSMGKYWKNNLDAIRNAWPDAPDRTLQQWGAYGPPVPPSKIVADYETLQVNDPTRPVFLNLGRAVAWNGEDNKNRGVRRGHMEDYPGYVKGCDIISYDIYPGINLHPDVAGKLELTALGVDRLRRWSGGTKIVWNIIEAAHTVGKSPRKATPDQVRSQVWMSIVHGSRGIIYIVHQFAPTFVEAGLLADTPEDRTMLKVVTDLNRRIQSLAPVLNSPTITGGATVKSTNKDVPVDIMVKRHGGATYLFAVAMRGQPTRATFVLKDVPVGAVVEVIGEKRTLPITDGAFADRFDGYQVHLYRIIDVDRLR